MQLLRPELGEKIAARDAALRARRISRRQVGMVRLQVHPLDPDSQVLRIWRFAIAS